MFLPPEGEEGVQSDKKDQVEEAPKTRKRPGRSTKLRAVVEASEKRLRTAMIPVMMSVRILLQSAMLPTNLAQKSAPSVVAQLVPRKSVQIDTSSMTIPLPRATHPPTRASRRPTAMLSAIRSAIAASARSAMIAKTRANAIRATVEIIAAIAMAKNQRDNRDSRNGRNDRNDRHNRRDRNNRRDQYAPKTNIDDLSALRVAELREKAAEFEIEITAGMKKAELVDKVFEASVRAEGFIEVTGILDIMQDGYGFLRTKGYLPSEQDVYIGTSVIRRNNLRKGDMVKGQTRPARENEKYAALQTVISVNGIAPEEQGRRVKFADLTPIFPMSRLLWSMVIPRLPPA